jgi:tight adherence protein B
MGSASVAAGLIAFLVGGPALASLAIIAVVLAPWILRRRRARGEASALEAQLAHAVDAVSAALRAGLSLSQAIRYAAGECEPRVAQELRAVAEREDLGVPLDAALDQWEKGSPSDDVRLVANALRLRIGPGLPGVLDEVGRALRQRRAIAGEVRSLTAQARLSGTILGILPIGFFAFLALTSRHDMAAALATPAGIAAVVAGLVLQGGGYLWIRRLVRVETM